LLGTGFVGWTLWETRIIARRDLRAYVGISRMEYSDRGVEITLRNYGQTPAFKVCMNTSYAWTRSKSLRREHNFGIIDPGEDQAVIHLTRSQVSAGLKSANAHVIVILDYDDAFSGKWRRQGKYLSAKFNRDRADKRFYIEGGLTEKERA
jgi:hypothetical protein